MRYYLVIIFLVIFKISFSIGIDEMTIVLTENAEVQILSSQLNMPENTESAVFILGEEDLGITIPSYPYTGKRTKRKVIALTLAVTLGVFGVHRLYLGTSTKVPIIYTLTLGGGFGVLVVSDIIAILATKNLDAYSPNEKVFMWAE
jgi:TM2 domain-containing membrane protein YozV